MKLSQPDRFLQLAKKESIRRCIEWIRALNCSCLGMLSEDLRLKLGKKSYNFCSLFFIFLPTFPKNFCLMKIHSAGSIPVISQGGIDPSIHRVDQSFKLQL